MVDPMDKDTKHIKDQSKSTDDTLNILRRRKKAMQTNTVW